MADSLFDPDAGRRPARDIWTSEELWRLSNQGTYWTPEGPRNGHYVAPDKPEEEPREPARARERRVRAKRVMSP